MMWGNYLDLGWWAVLSTLFWLVLIGLTVWALVALVRWASQQTRMGSDRPLGGTTAGPSAEEILRRRFARGEIDAATYERMRERLDASPVRQPVGKL